MTLAVLCPGQGAQHVRMLDRVLGHPQACSILDAATEALGDDPRRWLREEVDLFANAVAQPLICTTQLATWALLAGALPSPIAFAGYSVGELSCYGLAGALDARALTRLASARARLMDQAAAAEPGGLIAIRGLTRTGVDRCCAGERAWIAIANGADAFVVGGTHAALAAVERRARAEGGQVTPLPVGIASHTPLLETASALFRAELSTVLSRAPSPPVVAGIDARLVTSVADAIETLSMQLSRTVEWTQCIDVLYERGCRVFLELPPGHALARIVHARHDDVEARGVDEFRDLGAIVRWIESRRNRA